MSGTSGNRRWPALAAIMVAVTGMVLVGCTPSTSGSHASVVTSPPVPAAKLTITPATGSQNVAPDAPITVTASSGKIRDVKVQTAGDPVSGSLDAKGTTWTSSGTLNVSQAYTVTATGVNSAGKTSELTSTFNTLTPDKTFKAHIYESENGTYGVGMPIIVTLNSSIPDALRKSVTDRLTITSTPPVT
ncbi:MAG TPA: Ig-like domain-containing protein, partial [Pseudonocardiaceae bacterium]